MILKNSINQIQVKLIRKKITKKRKTKIDDLIFLYIRFI